MHVPFMKLASSVVVCIHSLVIALAFASAANAGSRMFEVQLDLFRNSELLTSPLIMLMEGKPATVSIGERTASVLVDGEGLIDGQPMVSVNLDVFEVATDTGSDIGHDRTGVKDSASSKHPIFSSSLMFSDSGGDQQSAMISIGQIQAEVRLRRLSLAETAEILANTASSDCLNKESPDPGLLSFGGEDRIGDGPCCQRPCADGSGQTMTCCGGTATYCGCGVCCSP